MASIHNTELSYSLLLPSLFYCNNQSYITLGKNPKFHDRSKHINLRFHFLHEKVKYNILRLIFNSIETMYVDILTKSLPKH